MELAEYRFDFHRYFKSGSTSRSFYKFVRFLQLLLYIRFRKRKPGASDGILD